MCSSLNPQKSIRIDAELCDGVQAYALANRLALKPRWFSNFINSAVREKLVREGFLPADASYSISDSLRSARDGFINPEIAKELVGLVGTSINGAPADGSRCVLGGSVAQGGDFVPSGNSADEGVLLGNPTNDTPDGSRDVLGGSAAQGGDVIVPAGGLVPSGVNLQNPAFCGGATEDKKLLDRIAKSEEPYLAYLVEKNSRADNQDNYPHGFNYPQNLDNKADVPLGCKKPDFVDSIDNCPKKEEEVIGNRRVITYPANIKTGTVGLIVDVSDVPVPSVEKKSDSSESQNREVR